MRCKKHHLTDLSSSVGVCASCLRERLFSIIAAQTRAQQVQEDHRKSDALPPPLVFPRSVSPYVCRRELRDAACDSRVSNHRFYSSPQIGPTGSVPKKSKSRWFSLFSRLFRSRPKEESDLCVSATNSRNSTPSRFTSIFSGRQKRQSRMFTRDESTATYGRKTCRVRDRGMSPARVSDCGDVEECYEESSGYSSETSQGWMHTPSRAVPSVRRGGGRPNHAPSVSGLAFCLSPLVRASPHRHWNQKGMTPEMAFSGEIRTPVKPNLSIAAAYHSNRSRKIADFGRFNHNH